MFRWNTCSRNTPSWCVKSQRGNWVCFWTCVSACLSKYYMWMWVSVDAAGNESVTEGIPAVMLTVIVSVCLNQHVRVVTWSFQPSRSDPVNFWPCASEWLWYVKERLMFLCWLTCDYAVTTFYQMAKEPLILTVIPFQNSLVENHSVCTGGAFRVTLTIFNFLNIESAVLFLVWHDFHQFAVHSSYQSIWQRVCLLCRHGAIREADSPW